MYTGLPKKSWLLYKYSSLNSLTKLQECAAMQDLSVAKNAQYTSYHIAEEIQEPISHCIADNVDHLLSESLLVGLLLDESTDIASSKNLIGSFDHSWHLPNSLSQITESRVSSM